MGNLFVTCTANTIELKGLLTNEYSANQYHSFAKNSFRVVENAGEIKLMFPAHNNQAIWTGPVGDIIVDGFSISAAAFKTYTQNNFYASGDSQSSNKINIPSSTADQTFAMPANSWLIGISIFPDDGVDSVIRIGLTPNGEEILVESTFTQGILTDIPVVRYFMAASTIYITNVNNISTEFNIVTS